MIFLIKIVLQKEDININLKVHKEVIEIKILNL